MILKFIILLFCVNLFVSAEDHVVELTDQDFEERVGQVTTLVMFYAPWCGHCKRLKPIYDEAAKLLQGYEYPIVLAKVDCTESGKETCNDQKITGYPTLKIFKDGNSIEYNGPRGEAFDIAEFMKTQVGPASKEITSKEDLKNFVKEGRKVHVIGFFEGKSDLKTTFLRLADKLRQYYHFGHSTTPEVLKELGEIDAIVLYRPSYLENKFEKSSIKFEGNTYDDLKNFIQKNKHGLVGHRTYNNKEDFDIPLVVAYYKVDYDKNPKGTNYWRNRIFKVANEFADKCKFAISDKDEFRNELNDHGYDFIPSDKPVVLARDSKNQKFKMSDEFSLEAFKDFLKKFTKGELEPYIKSEDIPSTNDAPVKIAVAKNFIDVVINNGKDTLIEFYAPWCGHCKKLAPTLDELAEKLLLLGEDVSIVKIDATANDVPPEYEVRGFPTLFWLPKDAKDKPIPYNGERTVDEFIKFIAKHATNELKSYDRSGKPKKTEL